MRQTIIVTFILTFTIAIFAYASTTGNPSGLSAYCDRRIEKVGTGDDVKYVFSNNAGASGSNGGLINGVATAHADVHGNSHVGHDTQHFGANFVHVWVVDSGSYGASAIAYCARSGYDSGGTYHYDSIQDSNSSMS